MKTSRCRWIYGNLLRKLTFIQGISSLPLVTEKSRMQINRRMWSKSVFRKTRGGGGAQENYPRMKGGMRDCDSTSIKTGSDWGGTRWQQRSIQGLIHHFFYVNTSSNMRNHGRITCRTSQLQLTCSVATMAPCVKCLHPPGDTKNTFS
jgi:hypothetical protein